MRCALSFSLLSLISLIFFRPAKERALMPFSGISSTDLAILMTTCSILAAGVGSVTIGVDL
jgi:hypothetical protein